MAAKKRFDFRPTLHRTKKKNRKNDEHVRKAVNQYVRISHLKGAFTRAYDETYSGEIFQVSKRYYTGNLPIYRLKDLQGHEIKGTWYNSELLPLYNIDPDKITYKLDKTLKT